MTKSAADSAVLIAGASHGRSPRADTATVPPAVLRALTVNGFLLMMACYLLKPVREDLMLSQNSAEIRSYAVAVIAAITMILVPVYARMCQRRSPLALVAPILFSFIATLALLAYATGAGYATGFVFFIWQGVFIVSAVAQFWALSATVCPPSQGTQAFPLIAFGVGLGAWAGSQVAALAYGTLGPCGLMLIAAGILVVALLLTQGTVEIANATAPRAGIKGAQAATSAKGFSLVLSNRYIGMLALSVVLLNWINSTGEYILAETIRDHVAELGTGSGLPTREITVGAVYSRYFALVTWAGLLIQLLLIGGAFRFAGIGRAALVLPALMLIGYTVIGLMPLFGLIFFYMVMENSICYSLHNTTRHALFLPLPEEAKFQAKTVIDTFFWRVGDLIQAAVIFVGVRVVGLESVHLAIGNGVLALVFVWASLSLRRRYRAAEHSATATRGKADQWNLECGRSGVVARPSLATTSGVTHTH